MVARLPAEGCLQKARRWGPASGNLSAGCAPSLWPKSAVSKANLLKYVFTSGSLCSASPSSAAL